MKRVKVNITKDILKQAANRPAGIKSRLCPVSLALKSVFPNVGTSILNVYAISGDKSTEIPMPAAGKNFVSAFDKVDGFPDKVMQLDEISFDLMVPQEIMDKVTRINEGGNILDGIPAEAVEELVEA